MCLDWNALHLEKDICLCVSMLICEKSVLRCAGGKLCLLKGGCFGEISLRSRGFVEGAVKGYCERELKTVRNLYPRERLCLYFYFLI